MSLDAKPYVTRKRETRSGDILELDGQWFEDCTFIGCVLIFRGAEPFGYTNTQFQRCQFRLEGAARMVADRIAGMIPLTDADDMLATFRALAGQGITLN